MATSVPWQPPQVLASPTSNPCTLVCSCLWARDTCWRADCRLAQYTSCLLALELVRCCAVLCCILLCWLQWPSCSLATSDLGVLRDCIQPTSDPGGWDLSTGDQAVGHKVGRQAPAMGCWMLRHNIKWALAMVTSLSVALVHLCPCQGGKVRSLAALTVLRAGSGQATVKLA